MKQTITKQVTRVGNSAGVVLPRAWVGGVAEIVLVEKPLDLKGDVFDMLDFYLEHVKGIYLCGSYARGDFTSKSDVDVLVVTDEINKKIENGKYNLILISEEKLKETLKANIFPLLPMILESKVLLNGDLIKEYKDTEITNGNLKFYFETTKSALRILKSFSKLDSNVGMNLVYSLVLRLRSVFIVDCLINGENYGSKKFVKYVKDVLGSNEFYNKYLELKEKECIGGTFSSEILTNGIDFIEGRLVFHKKWLREKKLKRR